MFAGTSTAGMPFKVSRLGWVAGAVDIDVSLVSGMRSPQARANGASQTGCSGRSRTPARSPPRGVNNRAPRRYSGAFLMLSRLSSFHPPAMLSRTAAQFAAWRTRPARHLRSWCFSGFDGAGGSDQAKQADAQRLGPNRPARRPLQRRVAVKGSQRSNQRRGDILHFRRGQSSTAPHRYQVRRRRR